MNEFFSQKLKHMKYRYPLFCINIARKFSIINFENSKLLVIKGHSRTLFANILLTFERRKMFIE